MAHASGAATGPAQAPADYRAVNSDSLFSNLAPQEGPGQTPVPGEHLPSTPQGTGHLPEGMGQNGRIWQMAQELVLRPHQNLQPEQRPGKLQLQGHSAHQSIPTAPQPADTPSPAPAWHPQHPAVYLRVCVWGSQV